MKIRLQGWEGSRNNRYRPIFSGWDWDIETCLAKHRAPFGAKFEARGLGWVPIALGIHISDQASRGVGWMAISHLAWLALSVPGQLNFFAPKPPPTPPISVIEEEISRGLKPKVLSLEDCLSTSMEFQPRIEGAKASLRAAQAAYNGVAQMRGLARLAPDLSARRAQSAQGLEAAEAALNQEIEDTRYAVRRAYFTIVYAEIQADHLTRLVAALERTKTEHGKDFSRWALEEYFGVNAKMRMSLAEAKNQLAVAQLGKLKAKFLLAEEMGGIGALGYLPEPMDKAMLKPKISLTLDDLEKAVDENRGERILSRTGLEVSRLEVEAQRRSNPFGLISRTYAAFADTNRVPIPTPERGSEYRPGAINLEMPPFMGGPKPYRVERAIALADRAESTDATTTNLTRLEARVAYLTYREIERRLEADRTAIDDARRIFNRVTKSTLSPLDAFLLPQSVQFLVNYDQLRFDRALIAAELMRLSGGSIEIPFQKPASAEPSTDPNK